MFRIAKSFDDLIKVFVVRAIVFCEEQQIPYDEEVDRYEHSAIHVLGEINAEPFASGRIRCFSEFAKFERLAVRKAYRGKGYGKQLMQYMLGVARERGFSKFILHAQVDSAKFYIKQGFTVKGTKFMEANIPHYLMEKED